MTVLHSYLYSRKYSPDKCANVFRVTENLEVRPGIRLLRTGDPALNFSTTYYFMSTPATYPSCDLRIKPENVFSLFIAPLNYYKIHIKYK